MTSKLTITDERVISVIERLEHYACNLKWTNVRGAQDLLTAADGLRELQERRKAAMDSEPAMESEPVAIENFRSAMEGIGHIRRTLEETFGGLHGTHVEPDVLAECKAICDAIYAAYGHAQPAPVVPNGLRLALSNAGIAAPESDEMLAATCEKHIQALVTWVRDRKPFQSAPVVMDDRKLRSLFDSWFASDCSFDLSPEASEEDNIAWRESYWYVWNACRAAMLQAGNSPVIPDGYRLQPISEYEAMCATVNSDEWPQRWIPVSERMPEDRTQVILWDAEIGEVISGHYSHKTHTFYHCGDAIQNEITHWMPLPAAPQEVK
ncbi:TPA: DUF551 domain-containing protein [Klebsiella pneumoniae]